MQVPQDLVYIDKYGLLGSNFYWHKYEAHGISKQDILDAGLTSDRVQVSKQIIKKLVEIDEDLQDAGMRLYIKEGYRSNELYEIVYKRRVEKYGQEETDAILNMLDRPHASGLSVDVALWDMDTNKEIYMRKSEDGVTGFFINFYKDKTDTQSKKLQDLQDLVAEVMMSRGFRFGKKREYFHFNYRPSEKENYI